jgi:hypothetical protein
MNRASGKNLFASIRSAAVKLISAVKSTGAVERYVKKFLSIKTLGLF